ncbi:MAG: hypothetical protein KAJ16_11640, partial [Calditrichia bacterium]|nr:hypothetical protein [Calditrichia bacterium]
GENTFAGRFITPGPKTHGNERKIQKVVHKAAQPFGIQADERTNIAVEGQKQKSCQYRVRYEVPIEESYPRLR